MKKEDVHLGDIKRILLGDAPPFFLLEVFIRTLILYTALLLVMRLLGKRMKGQMSSVEMAVMLTLGAIVSGGMQLPDRGILLAMFTLVLVLIFQQAANWMAFKSEKVAKITLGTANMVVKDGILQLDILNDTRISRHQLFAALREQNIMHLGKVKRVYIEAHGRFSIYKEKQDKPGLSILPPGDEDILNCQELTEDGALACNNCGYVIHDTQTANHKCDVCHESDWIKAMK